MKFKLTVFSIATAFFLLTTVVHTSRHYHPKMNEWIPGYLPHLFYGPFRQSVEKIGPFYRGELHCIKNKKLQQIILPSNEFLLSLIGNHSFNVTHHFLITDPRPLNKRKERFLKKHYCQPSRHLDEKNCFFPDSIRITTRNIYGLTARDNVLNCHEE